MKQIDYDEVIRRLGYFRNLNKLSMRETSLRLGQSDQFMKTIENKSVNLKVKTLLEFCEIVGITLYDFVYLGDQFSPEHKECLNLFLKLSDENKKAVIQIMKSMK